MVLVALLKSSVFRRLSVANLIGHDRHPSLGPSPPRLGYNHCRRTQISAGVVNSVGQIPHISDAPSTPVGDLKGPSPEAARRSLLTPWISGHLLPGLWSLRAF